MQPLPERFEKLGAFYLGQVARTGAEDDLLLYDSSDLTTHAMCVGMTGSGKTGLCICLLEEAAMDGVPAIALDLKGDLTNLMLTFPELRPADFEPWVDSAEAARRGQTPAEAAAAAATLWTEGLAKWGEDGNRIRRLRDRAEFVCYTPGATFGTPLSVLGSLACPSRQVLEDADALNDRVSGLVSGLLTLVGQDADPLTSRAYILLANILTAEWGQGKGLSLVDLIRSVQDPPIRQVGAFDLESFYPSKDRFALAMTLNNLLASPTFAAWTQGEALDVQRLLYSPAGRPRLSILYLAHLSESERMFFVTLLLNEVLSWMRAQQGTTSLRALLYMDEVFGFLPPVANPPAKRPMLTLLKQARAYGLGIVLATQNPVDLDYKALSNMGTWFLGRLQTERDQMRVLDGLEGASAASGGAFEREKVNTLLAGLEKRMFLLHNVHEEAPELFRTRWAMSYLPGPLSRSQVEALCAGSEPEPGPAAPREAGPAARPVQAGVDASGGPPVLHHEIESAYVPISAFVPQGAKVLYRPALLGAGKLHFVKARVADAWRDVTLLAPLSESPDEPWGTAEVVAALEDLEEEGLETAAWEALPREASVPGQYKAWEKQLRDALYQSQRLELFKAAAFSLTSEPDETEGDFRVRLRQAAREERDREVSRLRERYGGKMDRLKERIRKAEQRIGKEKGQFRDQSLQAAISVGSSLLGAFFGRRRSVSTAISSAASRAGRAAREKADVDQAEEDLAALTQQLEEMKAELEAAIDEIGEKTDADAIELEQVLIPPRKSDITTDSVKLVWLPWLERGGTSEQAYELS